MTLSELQAKSLSLPETPGVYLMKNADGKIIYVGKAKNLKRRVHSYFSAMNKHNAKTAALVSKISDFDFIMVSTELESLILENTMIKKYKPHYNILLKDDKGYPFIKISEGEFPIFSLARKRELTGEFYGPFYGSRSAKSIIETVNSAFKLPLCKNPQPSYKRKPCLNYSIKRCCAPCAYKISAEKYALLIDGAREFLKGDTDEIIKATELKMEDCAEKLDFEMAAVYRDRLKAIRSVTEKQKVSSDTSLKGDYVYAVEQNGRFSVSILKVNAGLLTDSVNFICKTDFFESFDEFVGDYLRTYYGQDARLIPSRICSGFDIEDKELLAQYLSAVKGKNVRIVLPQNDTDKQIADMAKRNANERIILDDGKTGRFERMFFDLASMMGVPDMEYVEIYDISHLAGSDVVCGMAACTSRGFAKSKYKKYKISPENAADDYASLKEALERRIVRFENKDEAFMPLPDVIFADGGKAQVNAMREIVDAHGLNIRVFGLKKDSKHKTKSLVYPDGHEIYLYKHPEIFGLCGRMQEEAHRFAVAYHNAAAKKRTLESMFMQIEGIGKARAAAIIRHFGSLSAVKKASLEELSNIPGIGDDAAKRIYDYIEENLL